MNSPDYPHWEFQPRHLTQEETDNPAMVLQDFFEFGHLPEIRKMMAEWIEATVTGGYNNNLELRERSNLYYFFQRVEKLIEAAHLLNKRT